MDRSVAGLTPFPAVAGSVRLSALLALPSAATTVDQPGAVLIGATSLAYPQTRRGLGIQCTPFAESAPRGPVNYSVSDIGKKGMPRLSVSQRAAITKIRKYVHSRALRFAFVNGGGEAEFVVFDARDGACAGFAPGYPVLNGACNEVYEPGENPDNSHGVPACIGPPRPWVPSDKGLPGDPAFWSR